MGKLYLNAENVILKVQLGKEVYFLSAELKSNELTDGHKEDFNKLDLSFDCQVLIDEITYLIDPKYIDYLKCILSNANLGSEIEFGFNALSAARTRLHLAGRGRVVSLKENRSA